ncbi:MAG: phage tail assembly protein [Alphaproteobacteria bacterium]
MSVQFSLKFPIQHEGRTIDTLTFRRLTMADMLTAMKQVGNQAELGAALLAISTEIDIQILAGMDLADFIQSQAMLAEFLGVPVPGFGAE